MRLVVFVNSWRASAFDARVAGVKTEWVDMLNKAGYPGEAMAERVHELQAKYARPWKDSLSMKIFREGQNQ